MINGALFRDAVISAAITIDNRKREIDELNVYPVPDGDTGTNMSMTIGNSVSELKRLENNVSISETSSVAASAFLRGARGNSGEFQRVFQAVQRQVVRNLQRLLNLVLNRHTRQ